MNLISQGNLSLGSQAGMLPDIWKIEKSPMFTVHPKSYA